MLKTYKVLESNLPEVKKMIEKINKRAKKIKQPEIIFTIDKEYFEDLNAGTKIPFPNIVKFYDITINAEPVKIEGYTILAAINHTYDTGNIIRTLSGIEIPEKYRTIDGICEHCHINRKRKETVLLKNEEGNIIQVGKTCLKDFLGYDINDRLSYMNLITEIEKDECFNTSDSDSIKFTKYIDVIRLLNISNLIIKNFGYVKTTDERMSTKERSLNLYFEDDIELHKDLYTSKEIEIYNIINTKGYKDNEVLNVIDWIKKQNNNSDYINNLQVLVNNKYINYKEVGILCSLMVCYYKAQEVQKENAKKLENITNEYVGTVGEKIQIELVLKSFYNYETEWGVSTIYIFNDSEGHEYKWSTAKNITKGKYEKRIEEGDKIILKGTIKKHEEYKSIKQTVLTRCKVVEK